MRRFADRIVHRHLERSVYRWLDGYWLFLVDLTTKDEEVSDLTLHAKLADASDARLEVQSVHVP
ncbi:DUF7668 domain-containing protein [Hephaestia caeni]|jgi:hypothetical protein|uniref:DUF7668 domain-containing protein n=1 Tax=Hephaestia caeni TaxID=645617 RepID=UPI003CCC8BDD